MNDTTVLSTAPRGHILRMPIDDADPEWSEYYIPLNQNWLASDGLVDDCRGLRNRLEKAIGNTSGTVSDRLDMLIRFMTREKRRGTGGFPSERHYAVMLFLVVANRKHPDAPVITIKYYVESLGFGIRDEFFGDHLNTAIMLITQAAGIRAHEAAIFRNREAEQRALKHMRRLHHLGESQRILYTLVLALMAGPVVAELGAIGRILTIANQILHFFLDYYKITRDDKIESGEWFALIIGLVGFVPVARLQNLLGKAGLGMTVHQFFVELDLALFGVEGVGQLNEKVGEMGGTIHAGDNFTRLGGDVLSQMLRDHPDLRDQVGRSTEAELRAKTLNSVLKSVELSRQSKPSLPGAQAEVMALESLDERPERNFNGRDGRNLFSPKETGRMPRRFTYVVRAPIGDVPPAQPGQKAPTPSAPTRFRYERVIVYMEEKLSVGRALERLIGEGQRRPDYGMLRYPISDEELQTVQDDRKRIQPRFREATQQALQQGKTLPVRNAFFKSIDFNTHLTGKAALNHLKKHVETFSKFVAGLHDNHGLRFETKIRVLLRDWYHNSPWVFKRGGKAHLTVSPRTAKEIQGGKIGTEVADPKNFSHTIELEGDLDQRGRLRRWLKIKSLVGKGIKDSGAKKFLGLVTRLRRSLRVIIGRGGFRK